MEIRTARDFRRVPWKNGGGFTTELWRDRESDFTLRLSVATISSSGPFSSFPGYERTIVQLDGGLVKLTGDVKRQLSPFVPFAFSGDAKISATLDGEPARDFNVIYQRGRWRISVLVAADIGVSRGESRGLFCYIDRGKARVASDQTIDCEGPTLVRTDAERLATSGQFPAIIVAVADLAAPA